MGRGRAESQPPQCAQVVLHIGNGLWSLQLDIMHTVSLGVTQHIAGNILREIIYVVLASRGTAKSRVRDLWPVIVEGYRLDSSPHIVHAHRSKQAAPGVSTAQSQGQGD